MESVMRNVLLILCSLSAVAGAQEGLGSRVSEQPLFETSVIFAADSGRFRRNAYPTVAALPGVRRLEGAVRVKPSLDQSVPATGASFLRGSPPKFLGYNGAGVIVGAVDTGVDLHHFDFDNPLTGFTRLLDVWDVRPHTTYTNPLMAAPETSVA